MYNEYLDDMTTLACYEYFNVHYDIKQYTNVSNILYTSLDVQTNALNNIRIAVYGSGILTQYKEDVFYAILTDMNKSLTRYSNACSTNNEHMYTLPLISLLTRYIKKR